MKRPFFVAAVMSIAAVYLSLYAKLYIVIIVGIMVHIEHEAIRRAEAIDLGQDLECAPGLNILVLRLRDLEFG